MKDSIDFGSMDVSMLFRKLLVPTVLGMVFSAIFVITDGIFVGKGIGSDALAAVNIAAPFFMIATGIGLMFGIGGSVVASIHLSQGKNKAASINITQALIFSSLIILVMSVLCCLFVEPLAQLLGSSEKLLPLVIEYMLWYLPFLVFYELLSTGMFFIRLDGSPNYAMMCNAVAAILNIILDYIFIFEFGWGMMGAAVATVIGQAITAVLAVWYLCHMKIVYLSKQDFRLDGAVCGRTLGLGITSFLSQISLVAAMAAINNMLRKYGALDEIFSQAQYAQIPMAVVGIVMKFFQIVISIVVGMAAGCIPIVGFNMGAGLKPRVKALFTKLLTWEALVGFAALLLVEFFPRQLIGIFGAANESAYYTDFAIRAFRVYLCMLPLACVNKACFIFLQAMGKAAESTALSMIREVVFGVGFAMLLPKFFALSGVLYSMPVSDVLTFAVAAVLIAKTYRELGAAE